MATATSTAPATPAESVQFFVFFDSFLRIWVRGVGGPVGNMFDVAVEGRGVRMGPPKRGGRSFIQGCSLAHGCH